MFLSFWPLCCILFHGDSSGNLDESFLNLLFAENEDDSVGDANSEAATDISDAINDADADDAELSPMNSSDEEYERK